MPLVGLGTWRLVGDECTETVRMAIELGYRHIDTAHVYNNHKAIRKALKGAERSEIFLTTKIANEQIDDNSVAKSVEKACDLALKELGTDYIDLYLLHWPDRTKPITEILQALSKLVLTSKVKAIGVSNCTVKHLQDALNEGISLVANQVEFHPYLYQKELLQFCKQHQITLISYRSFGKGAILSDSVLSEIGKRHNKSTAQIVLRWLAQRRIPAIPKASSPKYLKENLAIFDFSLSQEEMSSIDVLNRNQRFCSGSDWTDFDY